MYEDLRDLYEVLCGELCEYCRKNMTMETLHVIDILAHSAKNVAKLMDIEDNGGYVNWSRKSYRTPRKHETVEQYASGESVKNETAKRHSRGNNVTDGLRELMNSAPPEMQADIDRLIQKLDNM